MDEIDKQIIELLFREGRMKLVHIGEQLASKKKKGYSHVGVKKRIAKLVESDTLKVQANLNIKKLGLVMGLLLLETKNYDATRAIVEKYSRCPRVLFSFQTTDKYNIIQGILAESIQELEAYINYCSAKNDAGIRSSKAIISTTNFKPNYFPVGFIISHKLDKPPCGSSDCSTCDYFDKEDCTGCPAWVNYRGSY
ncbi:MAG: hypothetical protein ACTSU5_12900 [Promethearchaeota archaeon]